MAEFGLKFDSVVTSPLKRAKDTALIVNKAMKRKGRVEEWAELSPEGSRDAFYLRLSKLKPASTVLCVGHEPYLTMALGDIIGRGIGRDGGPRIALRKAGMARLTVTGFTPKASGELRWLLTPKLIRNLA